MMFSVAQDMQVVLLILVNAAGSTRNYRSNYESEIFCFVSIESSIEITYKCLVNMVDICNGF
jgi:hypothetical protein